MRESPNYRKAFDLVADYLDSGQPITEGLIREIYQHLVERVRGNAAKPWQYYSCTGYLQILKGVTGKSYTV